MENKRAARVVVRSSAAAPLIGAVATLYGLYHAFNTSRLAVPTWRTAVNGIGHALAATVMLLALSLLLALFCGPGKGRDDERGAA